MEKIRMALSVIGVYVASVASTAAVTAATSPTLATRSADELSRYIAAGGGAVVC